MRYIRFLSKAVTVCSEKEKRFDGKNNHKYNKLANFWLNNISKFNYKILVVLLYTSLEFRLKKV